MILSDLAKYSMTIHFTIQYNYLLVTKHRTVCLQQLSFLLVLLACVSAKATSYIAELTFAAVRFDCSVETAKRRFRFDSKAGVASNVPRRGLQCGCER